MAVRGIRDTQDLDVLVLPELFEKLSENQSIDANYFKKWNRKRLNVNGTEFYPDFYLEKIDRWFDVSEVIKMADYIDGIPFQPLEHLVICKLDSGRKKDIQDVKLINKYLKKVGESA